MVDWAAAFSFHSHNVDRIDLGVAAGVAAAIACYRGLGFAHVGPWPKAIPTGADIIDVDWMTLTRATLLAGSASARPGTRD